MLIILNAIIFLFAHGDTSIICGSSFDCKAYGVYFSGYLARIFYFNGFRRDNISVDLSENRDRLGMDVSIYRARFADYQISDF